MTKDIKIMNRDAEALLAQEKDLLHQRQENKEPVYQKLKKNYLLYILLPVILSIAAMITGNIIINKLGGGGGLKFLMVIGITVLTSKFVLGKLKVMMKDIPEFADFILGKDTPAYLKLNSFLIDKTVENATYEKRYVDDRYLLVPTKITCKDSNDNSCEFYIENEDWTFRKSNKEIAYVDIEGQTIFCPEIPEEEDVFDENDNQTDE